MKAFRIAVGIVSCLPLAGLVGFLCLIVGFLSRAFRWLPETQALGISHVGVLAFFLGAAAAIPLVIGYLVYLIALPEAAEKKAVWAVALVLGNAVTLPFAWFHLVWRRAT